MLWLDISWESLSPTHLNCPGFHPSLLRPEQTSRTDSSCLSSPLPPLPHLQASLPPEPVLQRAGQMGVPDTRAADLWSSGTVSMCVRAPLDLLPLPTLCRSQAWDHASASARGGTWQTAARPGCPLPDSDPKAEGPRRGEQQPQSYLCQLGRLRVRSAVTQCWACRWAGTAAGLNSPGPAASWPGLAVGAQALSGKGSLYASPYGCRVSSSPLDAAQLSSRAATGRAAGRVGMGAGG